MVVIKHLVTFPNLASKSIHVLKKIMFMQKHEIDLLIVEDNQFFGHLLIHELKQCISRIHIRSKFDFNFYICTSSEDCIRAIRKIVPNKDTIAFVDYYLGDGSNGLHIMKLLMERSKNLQVIMK